jgi:predicted nucleotidyltransferase
MDKVKEKKKEAFIRDIANLIKKKFKAKEVILFGSLAWKKNSTYSDLDILVIMETKLKPYKQAALIRMYLDGELGIEVPMDLIVRTPRQIKERLKLGDFFIRKVVSKGIHL